MSLWTVAIRRKTGEAVGAWRGPKKSNKDFNNRWYAQVEVDANDSVTAQLEGVKLFRSPPTKQEATAAVDAVLAPSLPLNGTPAVEWQPMSADKELSPEERRAIIAEGVRRGFEIADNVWKLVKRYGYKDVTDCINHLNETLEAVNEKKENAVGRDA